MAYSRNIAIKLTTARRTGISGADTLTFADLKSNVTAIDLSAVRASSFQIAAAFSDAAATVGITPVYYDADESRPFAGAEVTLTASGVTDADGKYSATEFVANLGWPILRLACTTAPSAGTVDLYLPILVDDYA